VANGVQPVQVRARGAPSREQKIGGGSIFAARPSAQVKVVFSCLRKFDIGPLTIAARLVLMRMEHELLNFPPTNRVIRDAAFGFARPYTSSPPCRQSQPFWSQTLGKQPGIRACCSDVKLVTVRLPLEKKIGLSPQKSRKYLNAKPPPVSFSVFLLGVEIFWK